MGLLQRMLLTIFPNITLICSYNTFLHYEASELYDFCLSNIWQQFCHCKHPTFRLLKNDWVFWGKMPCCEQLHFPCFFSSAKKYIMVFDAVFPSSVKNHICHRIQVQGDQLWNGDCPSFSFYILKDLLLLLLNQWVKEAGIRSRWYGRAPEGASCSRSWSKNPAVPRTNVCR